jgi:hypothetical protein
MGKALTTELSPFLCSVSAIEKWRLFLPPLIFILLCAKCFIYIGLCDSSNPHPAPTSYNPWEPFRQWLITSAPPHHFLINILYFGCQQVHFFSFCAFQPSKRALNTPRNLLCVSSSSSSFIVMTNHSTTSINDMMILSRRYLYTWRSWSFYLLKS